MSSIPFSTTGVKRAFVSYLDSFFGATLTKKLIQSGVEVQGLVRNPQGSIPSKAKVVRRGDVDSVRKALLEADIVIYELIDSVDDAVSALRFLTSNVVDIPKRFVLISGFMSWFETPLLRDSDADQNLPPVNGGLQTEGSESEPITEEQYNRRVPHSKYLAWRDAEKLCGSVNSDRLQTFVIFAGLQYGNGENYLCPIFKQAWCLGEEGLPIYGHGRQVIPMIHVNDLCNAVKKIAIDIPAEELPSNRYIFAVDDGVSADAEEMSTWSNIVGAINKSLGSGKTFQVKTDEFCLHDGIEFFTIDLKVEPQTISEILHEDDWSCKSGFVQNIDLLAEQYRRARGVTPLRIILLGPPLSGKTFAARELSSTLSIPHFSVADAVAEYRYQLTELEEELSRLRTSRYEQRLKEIKEEKIRSFIEERRNARDEEVQKRIDQGLPPSGFDEDEDDVEEEFEVDLTSEELDELQGHANDDESDERALSIKEHMDEIKKVLSMKVKPITDLSSLEPPNPKDKRKVPTSKQAPRKKSVVPAVEDTTTTKLSDRALAIIFRWCLTRTQCRNQGYILDGYPKTVRQARLLFEDVPVEVFDDPDEPDMPLEPEIKPFSDSIFPDILIRCSADDTFLLERLQRVQHENPHNVPDEFQRRLDFFKQHFLGNDTVYQLFENARSATGRRVRIQQDISMDDSPLIPLQVSSSQFSPSIVDTNVQKMLDFIGKPHNFGPTPQDAKREAERRRLLLLEELSEKEKKEKKAREFASQEVQIAKKAKDDETLRINQMKEQERKMLEERKAPLKAYLMRSVIPILTKGLIEVCNKRPEDPVDYLAEWLFRHNPEDDSMY